MNSELILSFTSNIMLLMSLAVVYSFFPYESKIKSVYKKIIMGFFVALIGVTIMYTRFELTEGIVFDARAVAISVTAMFLGLIPTIIGGIAMITYRIIIGGDGVFTGILWVIFAGGLGLLWRHLRLKNPKFEKYKISWVELYLVGFIIEVTMVLLLLTLPSEVRSDVFNTVSLSLLIVFPIGSLLISEFMLAQRFRFFQHMKTTYSEKQYKKLFSDSQAMIFLINPIDTSFVDVNQSAINKYGYSKEEFLELKISDISYSITDDTIKNFKKILNNEITESRFKHFTKNKVDIDVEVYSGPMIINDIEYILATVFDVTERLEKEREFIDVDSKFRATLLSVGEGIVVTDKEHRITLINDKAMEILGESKKPLNKSICDIFRIHSNESEISFHELFHNCITNNEVFNSDVTYSLLKNDSDIETIVDFSISPIN